MTTTDSNDNNRILKGAAYYAEKHDWKILPCHGMMSDGRCTCLGEHTDPKDMGKHAAINRWQHEATASLPTIHSWWDANPDYNIGMMCRDSGVLVIDIDPRSGGFESFDRFEAHVNGSIPPTVEAITGAYNVKGQQVRGRHLYYSCGPSERLVPNLKNNKLPGIDIKHNGYVLVAPSRHFSGVEYEWKPGHAPWEIALAPAPEELLEALRSGKAASGGQSSGGGVATALGTTDWTAFKGMGTGASRFKLDQMIEEGIDEGSRAIDVYAMACALANREPKLDAAGAMSVETLMIRFNHEKVRPPMELEGPNSLLMHVRRAIQFVKDNPKHDLLWAGISDHETAHAWAAANATDPRNAPAPVDISSMSINRGLALQPSTSDPDDVDHSWGDPGSIGASVSAAVLSGVSGQEATHLGNMKIPKDTDALYEGEGGDPNRRSLTDTGNGRRLVDSFGSTIRYTPGLGWFHWSKTYWKPDVESLEIRELSKKISPAIAHEVVFYEDPDKKRDVIKWATEAKSNSRLGASISSATSDPRVIVDVENWDADVELLGVTNGVIDLRSGELLRGRPDLYITRRAPVAYNPGITNTRWTDFIDFATGGDKDLQDWLQRAAGYSITGLRTHDVMFLVYGPPGSGKNTFVEAIVKALGTSQYAWPLDSSILAQGDGNSHGTDLYHWAELRGRRLVWVDELPEGERFKENSVKKLTGSSEISARSPGEKPFTFASRAKLWVTTNHRPIITDDAMWRRIRPIPWSCVPEAPDPGLKEYLFDPNGGLPSVLAWCVEGAIKLLNSKERDSLGTCTAVEEASEIYRKNEDRIGMFLNEETVEIASGTLPMKSLYTTYRFWSEDRGEKPMTQIALDNRLRDRGENIVGEGTRSEVHGRILSTRSGGATTGTGAEVDWSLVTRGMR